MGWLVPPFDPRNPKRGTIRRALATLLLTGVGLVAFTLFVAMISTPRP